MIIAGETELIAQRLRDVRIKRGYYSCRAFSEKHGFNEQKHETGTHKISFATMIRYCRALNVSILWLQTGEHKYLNTNFFCEL